MPILDVKAYHAISSNIYTLQIFEERQIKSIIKLCHMDSPKLIAAHLTSMFSIS